MNPSSVHYNHTMSMSGAVKNCWVYKGFVGQIQTNVGQLAKESHLSLLTGVWRVIENNKRINKLNSDRSLIIINVISTELLPD